METVQNKSARWPKDCCKTQNGKLYPLRELNVMKCVWCASVLGYMYCLTIGYCFCDVLAWDFFFLWISVGFWWGKKKVLLAMSSIIKLCFPKKPYISGFFAANSVQCFLCCSLGTNVLLLNKVNLISVSQSQTCCDSECSSYSEPHDCESRQ